MVGTVLRFVAVWRKPNNEDDEPRWGRKAFKTAAEAAAHVAAVSDDSGCGFVDKEEWMPDPDWDEELDDGPRPMAWERIQTARCENGELWDWEIVE